LYSDFNNVSVSAFSEVSSENTSAARASIDSDDISVYKPPWASKSWALSNADRRLSFGIESSLETVLDGSSKGADSPMDADEYNRLDMVYRAESFAEGERHREGTGFDCLELVRREAIGRSTWARLRMNILRVVAVHRQCILQKR